MSCVVRNGMSLPNVNKTSAINTVLSISEIRIGNKIKYNEPIKTPVFLLISLKNLQDALAIWANKKPINFWMHRTSICGQSFLRRWILECDHQKFWNWNGIRSAPILPLNHSSRSQKQRTTNHGSFRWMTTWFHYWDLWRTMDHNLCSWIELANRFQVFGKDLKILWLEWELKTFDSTI